MKKKKNIRSLYGNIERVNASCGVAMKNTVCEEYLRSVSEEEDESVETTPAKNTYRFFQL